MAKNLLGLWPKLTKEDKASLGQSIVSSRDKDSLYGYNEDEALFMDVEKVILMVHKYNKRHPPDREQEVNLLKKLREYHG